MNSHSEMNIIANKDWGFLGGTVGKESACPCRRHKRPGFIPWVGKIPWSKKWQSTPVPLPGKFHGEGSRAIVQGFTESDTSEHVHQIPTHTHTHTQVCF